MIFLRDRIRPLCLATALGAAIIAPSSAQQVGQPIAQVPDATAADAQDNSLGVFVRDSAIALEKIALARRMERLHEWTKSADVYQEILQKFPDRVVRSDSNPAGIVQYTSVTEAVRQSLCKWPPEGLDVYRGLYETRAAEMLAAAGPDGLGKLHELFFLYFPTESAKAAGIRLMDAYFEQGDFSAVSQIGKLLLQSHPNLVAERPMVLYRTALAEKLSGELIDAKTHLDDLTRHFPQATGIVRGSEVLLADSLNKELASAEIVRGAATDDWLTVGGDETRGKVSSSTVKPGARLYSIPVAQVNFNTTTDQTQRSMQVQYEDNRKKGATLGIMPAVDHGELFFQDNTRIYAIDLDSGVPLPGWLASYPMQNGAFKLSDSSSDVPSPMPSGQQMCVSLNDKYVTAIMDQREGGIMQAGMVSDIDTRLVCLDRHSGQKIWTTSVLKLPDSQNNLRDLQIGGAPLMVGNNVYVTAHGSRGLFADCYVLCFDLSNGQFRWSTFVANANVDPNDITDDSTISSQADAVSHIAYAGGRLFIVTNLGAVASLDAYTGAIVWLDIYQTQPALDANNPNPRWRGMRGRMQMPNSIISSGSPWKYNSAIIQDGKLFILPNQRNENQNVFIYNGSDGSLVKRIWLSDLLPSDDFSSPQSLPDTLLAVDGDLLYLGSDDYVLSLPWREYDHLKNPRPRGPENWVSAPFSKDPTPDRTNAVDPVQGRGFVTGDSIYVPTQTSMRRILRKTGKLASDSVFPKNGWETDVEGPGNLIVTQDHVIVAGDRHVCVYTDIDLARVKLDREITAAPDQPNPRLHYAEVMFAAGQAQAAQDKLEEAFQLLGGVANLRSSPDRNRAFNDSLNFADRLVRKHESATQIDRLYDLAAAAAQSPEQQVAWRISRAYFESTEANIAMAIDLYQQILLAPALRAVIMPDPKTSANISAGSVAERTINELLAYPQGPGAYGKYQRQATDQLAAAQTANDPNAILEVARSYPNSKTARPALFAAANSYESKNDNRAAIQVLRRMLAQNPDQDLPSIYQAMARNTLTFPDQLDIAAYRLGLAAAAAPPLTRLERDLKLPDGSVLKNLTLGNAQLAVQRYSTAKSLDACPDFHLPTSEQAAQAHPMLKTPFAPESPNTMISHVDALLVPMAGFSRNDRLIAWSAAAGLAVYPAGKNVPLAHCAAISEAPTGVAWDDSNLFVWGADYATLIDEKANVLWKIDVSKLPSIGVAPSPDSSADFGAGQVNVLQQQQQPPGPGPETITNARPLKDRLIAVTSIGRVFAIDKATGRVLWQTRVSNFGVDVFQANNDFCVVRYQEGQIVSLVALAVQTGNIIGRKAFASDADIMPLNVALANDGTLAYTTSSQVCIQNLNDLASGDATMEPAVTSDVNPPGTKIFQGANQPGQLQVYGGRVFAVSDLGKFVRIYSQSNAKKWTYHDADGDVEGVLSTFSASPNTTLNISGNYLYAWSQKNMFANRIDPPNAHWPASETMDKFKFEQVLYGKDYIIIATRGGTPRATESNGNGTSMRLHMYLRPLPSDPTRESGSNKFDFSLANLGDTTAIQPFDGGLAYFSNGTIHTLLGLRDSLPIPKPAKPH